MFCRKCGNKLEEGSALCNYCGTQVITDKPSEEKEVIAEQEPVQEDVAKEIPSNTAKRSMKLPLIIGLGAAGRRYLQNLPRQAVILRRKGLTRILI